MWTKSLSSYIKFFNLRKIIKNYSQSVPIYATSEPISELNAFQVGKKVHGFEVKNLQNVNEFRATAVYLVHEKTKAEYLHLFRNDNNNTFSINFRTTPTNSTGLPHILEHTVLCGSQLFPVKDPFFKMLNRSLATFINALTGSDYTIYPFSTQNYSDFRNLQKIYLDAVFRPNLKELDFMQEGWRLENADPKDIKTDLIIKGVVYNEMKGVFSENSTIMAQRLQNLILPDHTYGVISGGDPMKIPELTWEDLKNFHKKHYHPSNAKFFSYGNFPLSPSLEYINNEYLTQFEYLQPSHTLVPRQVRWQQLKREHIDCRFDKMGEPFEKQHSISVSLLLSDITNIYDTFLMQFVSELLLRGPNAPFYKSMIEPNFSGGFTPTTGYDIQPRDSIFTIGLQGLQAQDFDKVVTLFDETLEQVIAVGFDEKHIESVLHHYEISIKHESSNFGLHLLFGLTPTWNHQGDIVESLQINQLIDRLKRELKNDPIFLQKIVKESFKNNKHRLILSMSPKKDFDESQTKMEMALIKKKTSKLSDIEKQNIFNKNLELLNEQNTTLNTVLLPTLTIDDINDDVERIPTEKVKIKSTPLQINMVNTNGIVYFRSLINTVELSQEQQMLLPLFCYVITKLGTKKLNYREFDSLVNRRTAGLSLSPFIGESLFQLHSYEPGISISSYCLEKNLDDMFELWSQIFSLSELNDVDRFQMLIQLYLANLTHGIADSGHIYAMQAAAALVSASAYQKELLAGLHHITYMKQLVKTSNYKAMLDEIFNIAKLIFNRNNMRCALNLSPDSQKSVVTKFEKFLMQLPGDKKDNSNTFVDGKVWAPSEDANCQHYVYNVPINFCSKSILTEPYATKEYPKLCILAKLLTTKYLHPQLREKYGAYGGGAKTSLDGVFTFYSYRDPRNLQTLDVFDNSFKWLRDELNKLTDQDLLEAKLGVFQSVDHPIPPSQKGAEEFWRRLHPDIVQRHRAEIMSVNVAAIKSVAEKYLSNQNVTLKGKVVIGPKEQFDISNRTDELWTVMDNE